MRMAPEIQETIDRANTKTAEAQAALGSARATATQARGKAENAQNLAQEIQNVITHYLCILMLVRSLLNLL